MKKKLVSFMCAVMAALCLAVSVPVQAYAALKDEIALQYIGISEISANLHFENGIAYCRGTTRAYKGYTVNLVVVLKRNNVEYARWEETVTYDTIILEKPVSLTAMCTRLWSRPMCITLRGSWWRHRQLLPESRPINTAKL